MVFTTGLALELMCWVGSKSLLSLPFDYWKWLIKGYGGTPGDTLEYVKIITGDSITFRTPIEKHRTWICFPGTSFWDLQRNSKRSSFNLTIVAIDLWHGALPWWNSCFFFATWTRFCLISSIRAACLQFIPFSTTGGVLLLTYYKI